MKKLLSAFLLFLVFPAPGIAQEIPFTEILETAIPAVVSVTAQGDVPLNQLPAVLQPKRRGNQQAPAAGTPPPSAQFESFGSGVIVDASKGYVLTNSHVVQDAKIITVTLHSGRKLSAKLIGTDPGSDIAVLQVPAKELKALSFGDSDALKVGQFVAAIGSPFSSNLSQTVTSGIISGLRRNKLGIEEYENFIQTNASINMGNSGGALVNRQGELIGINTAILAPEGGNIGIGFAIPINMARALMSQIIQYGAVKRGLMGVMMQDLTPDLADAMKISDPKGGIVALVQPGSPAEQAGFKVGDIIQEVNGKKVNDGGEVRNLVGLLRVGSKVSIKLLRDGKFIDLNVVTTDPKKYEEIYIAQHPFLNGVGLRTVDEVMTNQTRMKGVQITDIKRDTAAWRSGLLRGDVILSANGSPVTMIEQLTEAVKKNKETLLVNVFRPAGNGALYIVVK
ncbi:MAG: Do family serine endopeptidase [Gammaproteobacteria bacterium]